MPKIYRAMAAADDDKPKLGESARTLGIRVPKDIKPKEGQVHPNTGGLSVRPRPQDIPLEYIPKRLGPLYRGAVGPDSNKIFSLGEGPFAAGPVAPHLHLRPDSRTHGLVEPDEVMPLDAYRAAVAATRESWSVDEG